MPMYDYTCPRCGHRWEALVPYDQRNHQFCPECKLPDIERDFPAPALMQAAYPDGVRKFTEMREISKLQKERAGTRVEKRKDIEKEIKKLGGKVE